MLKNWQKKEKKDSESFGSKRTPRSGGLWFAKGDSKSEKYLIENKTSGKNSYTITRRVWDKIEKEALLSHRIPVMSIEFGDDPFNRSQLVIIDLNDFLTLDK